MRVKFTKLCGPGFKKTCAYCAVELDVSSKCLPARCEDQERCMERMARFDPEERASLRRIRVDRKDYLAKSFAEFYREGKQIYLFVG